MTANKIVILDTVSLHFTRRSKDKDAIVPAEAPPRVTFVQRITRRVAADLDLEVDLDPQAPVVPQETAPQEVHTFRSRDRYYKTFRKDLYRALRLARHLSRGSNFSNMPTHTTEAALAILGSKFPASTEAERKRFLKARRGNVITAADKLGEFMEWRQRHRLDCEEYVEARGSRTDAQDWEFASKLALEWEDDQKNDKGNRRFKKRTKASTTATTTTTLPQIVTVYYDNESPCRTRDAKLVLHVLPAQVNKKLASPETYALAKAIYLDLKFDRYSLEEATIFIDVRPGRGWANPPGYTMMPFITHVSKLLHQHFPERLHQCIVYPLPKPAIWIWDMAERFLDKSIVDSVLLIGGSDALTAEAPVERMSRFVDEELLERMEQRRVEFFAKPVAN